MKFDEEEFKEYIKPHLLKCRPGDWQHCHRVVYWVKRLGAGREDLELLIVAGYLHNVGWWDIYFGEKLLFKELEESKIIAHDNTRPYITEIMGEHGYTQEDIDKVVRLSAAADRHESVAEDEAILVDADSLSKLDINHLKDKYKESEWIMIFEDHYTKKIPQRLKTDQAKKMCPVLIEKLKKDLYNKAS